MAVFVCFECGLFIWLFFLPQRKATVRKQSTVAIFVIGGVCVLNEEVWKFFIF